MNTPVYVYIKSLCKSLCYIHFLFLGRENIGYDIECDKLCYRDIASSFRSSTGLKKFNFDTLASDLSDLLSTAPTVHTVHSAGKYSRKRPDCYHPIERVVIAAAILLREHKVQQHM